MQSASLQTRKAVIREMSHLVKIGLLVEETSHVLSELLQLTDRNDETTMVNDLLVRFLKSYPKGFNFFVLLDLLFFYVVCICPVLCDAV